MPDPTAHADDMKSLAVIDPNNTPAFWWVNPWGYALNLKRALDAVHLLSETTEAAYQAATNVIKQKQELVDYHRANFNGWQRKVELTLKPACPHLYEDTIGYVHWAADEIKDLRSDKAKCNAELLETKETVLKLIDGNERAEDDMTKAEARIKQLTMFCERAGAERDREKEKVEQITLMCNERDRQISALEIDVDSLSRQLRAAKRKLAKAEKAKPLWEDKTKPLTHGVSFTLGNYEDRHDPVREAYASLGRKFIKAGIKAQAKAKKKGARRA